MLKYAVVEIAGRQYKALPEQAFLVNFLGDVKSIDCDVLMKVDGDKLEIGTPYLKEKLTFIVEADAVKEKLRVATYKSKANTRRVKGSRPKYSKIQLKLAREKS